MNSIPQSSILHTAQAAWQIEKINPPVPESESACGVADVLMLTLSAVAAMIIQAAAISLS